MLILGNPVSVFLQLVIKTTWRVPFNGMSDSFYWVDRSLQNDCFFLGIKGYFICQRKDQHLPLKYKLHAWSDGFMFWTI